MIYVIGTLSALMLLLGAYGMVLEKLEKPKQQKPEAKVETLPEPRKKSVVDDDQELFFEEEETA